MAIFDTMKMTDMLVNTISMTKPIDKYGNKNNIEKILSILKGKMK